MKKLLFVCLIIVFISGNLFSGTITIKSPTSQTKWILGSNVKIKWIATGVTSRTKITLWRGGVFVGVIKDNILPSPPQVKSTEKSHVWRVGDYIGGKAESGKVYTIRIEEKGKSVTESNKYFEITKLKTRKR